MTGRGRCKRRRKSMAGGRAAARGKKIDGNIRNPNLNREITEKPSSSSRITNVPPTPAVDFLDLYTQARKSLSFTSPFDSDGSQAPRAFASSACTLPSGVSHFLGKQSCGRKRHKKLHSASDKKSSGLAKPRERDIWVQIEEYFRDLNVEDIERLDGVSSVGSSSNEKCFLIPFLNDDDSLCGQVNKINRMLTNACKKDNLIMENSEEFNAPCELECDGKMTQEGNGSVGMDVDGSNNLAKETEIKEEYNGDKKLGIGKDCRPFSGVEWLLGSRSKIYLASERPSKKRKLLGRDAGLEKLLVARPVEGSESICHYCSYGDMGDPLNFLITCASCGVMVHQRCYGVQEDVDSSWLCSWCKCKNVVGLKTETPCLLCPKRGGALKPVKKSCFGSENEGSKLEFAHLFCCQWIPEVYLENTRTMEPIMNMDKLKDTRKKLICYLCKVKCGACVRCSNGSCRTSFHPICAREARHKMEIWGKLGSEEVELRAFCSKHSEVQGDSGRQCTGEISLTADLDLSKQNHVVLDGDKLLDNGKSSEVCQENKDAPHLAAVCLEDRKINNVNACSASNFTMILKKLIELGKVKAKDVAPEIGVSQDSLITILCDDHMAPELQYKLLNWLKNHVHVGNLQNALKVKIRSLVMPKSVANATECVSSVSLEESSISDAVPVKSVPPHRRNKNTLRTVKYDKSYSSKDKNIDEIPVDNVDSGLVLDENSNEPSGDVLVGKTQKILFDPHLSQDNLGNRSIRIADKLTVLEQCLSEDDLAVEGKQIQQMPTCSFVLPNGHAQLPSYIHPLIYNTLMQTNVDSLEKTVPFQSAVSTDREASRLEVSSTSDFSCINNQRPGSGDSTSKCDGVNFDNLLGAKNLAMLNLSPADEVEGALMYYQQRLLNNAASRKHISDALIATIVRSLPQEIDASGKRKWDTVLIGQYIHDLRESKKQGRTERRHKEAQAVLAAATAAAAASSRTSSNRKDSLEEPTQQDTVGKEVDTCSVCCRKQGVCLKCCYGRCQTMFHPICARSAGFYMTECTIGRKLRHKAYCEKHSIEQRAKAAIQRPGIDEFKNLKQVRVELERLRLLCERVVKREKLKRELVLCSHDILTTRRDSVLSALACHPFYLPEVSYGSATTSDKDYVDSHRSGSDVVLRSDDTTLDSAVVGKMRIKFSRSRDNDRRTDDSSTSQSLLTLKPPERVSCSGKQIPHRATSSWTPPDDVEKHSKYRKHDDTFEKELIMTSGQASVNNLRPPKGFVYVPVRYVSKDKETLQDACFQEPADDNV